jgi:tetratricopeptide (TPR) repeat protein
MRTSMIPILAGLLVFWLLPAGQPAGAQTEAVAVDPADLGQRADLMGKMVVVDDRVRFYQYHNGRGYDEVFLKRTDVVFRLPPRLRPDGPPRPMPVVIQGRLARDNDQFVCDVTTLKVMPNDLDRLDQAIVGLPGRDFENRKAWAAWAEARGKAFKDNVLIQRGRTLEEDALRIEGERKQTTVDAPKELLALAEEGRRRHIAEPEPSALAHKALRSRLEAASNSDALNEVISSIEHFFPAAAKDHASGRIDLSRWSQAYSNNPGTVYRDRTTTADVRKALDRRLWADAASKLLEVQAALDPRSAIELASRAETELPDRPQLATKLLNAGLDQARQNLGSLRLAEVRALAQVYRAKLKNPQAALELYRNWLKVQRDRLSETDAEGPVALAALYEDLLQDRPAARELLERAWKIDPGSKDVAEAFRTRGYRLVKDQWIDDAPTTSSGETSRPGTGSPRPEPSSPHGLRGKTPDEVTQLMASKPDGKVISGTKGQVIEQWIFLVPNQNQIRFVNFLYTPGELLPRAVSDYFLPRNVLKGHLKPVP